ncbi:hypothetical protein ACLOJK_001099 [Asimina triloba]
MDPIGDPHPRASSHHSTARNPSRLHRPLRQQIQIRRLASLSPTTAAHHQQQIRPAPSVARRPEAASTDPITLKPTPISATATHRQRPRRQLTPITWASHDPAAHHARSSQQQTLTPTSSVLADVHAPSAPTEPIAPSAASDPDLHHAQMMANHDPTIASSSNDTAPSARARSDASLQPPSDSTHHAHDHHVG